MYKTFCDVCESEIVPDTAHQSGPRVIKTHTKKGYTLQVEISVYGAVIYSIGGLPAQKEHREVCWECVKKIFMGKYKDKFAGKSHDRK